MSVAASMRIELTVDAHHVQHIRACLANLAACTDVTVSPVISDWSRTGGCASGGIAPFRDIGSKVSMRFTADENLVAPLLKAGFGILGRDLMAYSQTRLAA